ncbi:MAG: SulP family inorganic anion transporter [Flammeovirgaceae bacterium]
MATSIEDEFISKKPNYVRSLPNDLPSGLVVFLVALPLCLGIALASGAPPFAGIISGVIGGIVVGFLSDSPLGVSGPAAGLAVIVADAVLELGFEVFLLTVVLAGIIQFVLGLIRAGIIGYYFPSSVIQGMLAGIGLILILKQIPHALGRDTDFEGDFNFLQQGDENTFTAILHAFENYNEGAVIITIISFIVLFTWDGIIVKRVPFLKIVPGALLVVIVGAFTNYLFWTQPALTEYALQNTSIDNQGNDHLVNIPVSTSFDHFLSFFTFPDFSGLTDIDVWFTGITIAIIASLETLLCVEATDKLDPLKRVTPTNRELRAQGIGNFISGMIGGLPVTQVIVRSSANISAGGKTKVSAIFHGVLLLLCVYFISDYLNFIPLASLAVILLFVGYKLARISLFVNMYKKGWTQFIPFVVTIVAIVFTDLLTGISIGMGVAIFYILQSNYRTPFYFQKEEHHEGDNLTIKLSEEVSFLNKASIMIMLEEVPKNSTITLDGSNSNMIDLDVIEIIENFITHAPLKNITVNVVNIPGIQQAEIERRARYDSELDIDTGAFRDNSGN